MLSLRTAARVVNTYKGGARSYKTPGNKSTVKYPQLNDGDSGQWNEGLQLH